MNDTSIHEKADFFNSICSSKHDVVAEAERIVAEDSKVPNEAKTENPAHKVEDGMKVLRYVQYDPGILPALYRQHSCYGSPSHGRATLQCGKFKEGGIYSVYAEKFDRFDLRIQVKDDDDRLCWVEETYFSACNPKKKGLVFENELEDSRVVPDLHQARKIVPKLDPENSEDFKSLKCLAGVQAKTFEEWHSWGVTEPPLLDNTAKIESIINEVFGCKNPAPERDIIITAMNERLKNKSVTLSWGTSGLAKRLHVGEVCTKIEYDAVEKVFVSLKALMSEKAALKTVAKIVCARLEQVF